jgi:hypothetical protein
MIGDDGKETVSLISGMSRLGNHGTRIHDQP